MRTHAVSSPLSVSAAAARIFAAVVFSALAAVAARAQTVNVQSAQNAVDFTRRSSAEVDPVTLALQLQIPLGGYPGRGGAGLPVTLNYSSKLWRVKFLNTTQLGTQTRDGGPEYDSRFQAMYAESSDAGWTSSLDFFNWPSPDPPGLERYDISGRLVSGTTPSPRVVARMYFTLPDGSRHELRRSDATLPLGSDTTTGTFYSVDGSRLRYESASRTIFMPDGSRLVTESDTNGVPLYLHYIDRNGNRNTYTYSTRHWTDTLGRTLASPLPAKSSTTAQPAVGDVTYTMPGVGASTLTYTFKWRNLSDALLPDQNGQAPPLRYRGDRSLSYPHTAVSPSLFDSFDAQSGVVAEATPILFNPVVLSQIVLPNGAAYTFKYDVWGEVTRVDYPAGAYETFTYGAVPSLSGQTDDGLYSQANRGVTSRTTVVPGGQTSTWAYSTTLDTTAVPYRLTRKVVAPDGSYTQTLYHDSRGTDIKYGFDDARAGRPYDERAYSPSGQMLRRTLTYWDYTGPVPSDNNSTATRDARPITRVDILLDAAGDALAKTTKYTYDSDLNVTSTSEYGFVSVIQSTAQAGALTSIPTGTLLRKSETTYLVNDAAVDQATRDAYRARGLISLPSSTRVRDGSNAVVAQTEVKYDELGYPLFTYGAVNGWADPQTNYRGNATTARGWVDTTNTWLEAHARYDQFGNTRLSWDARDTAQANPTQVDYSPTYAYAYPTSVTTPAPNPAAVSYTSGGTTYNFAAGTFGSAAGLSTSTSYDFNTGLVTTTTDANGRSTTYEYNDPLFRLTKENRPDGGWTTYEYGINQWGDYVHTTALLNLSGTSTSAWSYSDGLGRPYRTFSYDPTDSNNVWLTTDTQYDTMGRVWRVSNPYRSAGSASSVNPSNRWTTRAYDDLGRVKSVTTPDGAVITTSYVGNTVTVTDQHAAGTTGRMRRSVSDALGRLVRVDEPDAQTGALDNANGVALQPTYYTYDVLGNLRKVDQGGQLRFFMYDSLSRLIRAKNPEQAAGSLVSNITDTVTGNTQWSLAYGYDNNGNLTARADALGVMTNYTYDGLNRNTLITYTRPAGSGVDPTPDVRRYYDNAAAGANGLGRLYYSEAVGVSSSVYDSYDPMGRPLRYHQVFGVGGAWGQPFYVTRSYDKAGNVVSQTYPSGRTVTYGYDAAGRVSSFSGTLGDGVQRAYSTGVTYSEYGGIQQEQFGTQTPLYRKLRYNVRGQLYDTRLSTVSWATDPLDWNRGALVNCYSAAELGGVSDSQRALSGADNNGNLRRAYNYIPLDPGGTYNGVNASPYAYYQDDYDYDALNRLSYVAETSGVSSVPSATPFKQAYAYDRFGNRRIDAGQTFGVAATQFELSPATNQEVAEPSNRLYAPGDSARAPSQKLMRYDAAGNLVYDAHTGQGARVYDAENRMTQAQDVYQQWSTYTYDADGRRIKRVSAGQETWQVYGTGGELLAEYQAGAATFLATKEYGYRGGELLVTMSSGDTQRLKRFVKNLYYNCLARDPNSTELQQKTDQLAQAGVQGESQLLAAARAVARGLFESAEYAARNRTNTEYVTDLYNAYLQRAPDTTGLNFWVSDAQNNGRGHTLTSFEVSTEFITLSATVYGTSPAGDNQRVDHFIDEFYLGAYNRFPTTAERQQQEQRLNNAAAVSQDQVKAEARLMGAEIFQATNYNSTHSNSQYVIDLYEAFLQRAPDGLGLSFWVGKVQNEGRASALAGFQNSTEFGELAGTLYRETFWLVADYLGTPRMVVDKSGSLTGIKRHDYLPFGEELGTNVGGRTPTQGYATDNVRQKFGGGQERDGETGMDFMQARYYSSAMGRFTSPDSLAGRVVNPQTLNLYSYVRNNPLKYVDPTGHQTQEPGGPKPDPNPYDPNCGCFPYGDDGVVGIVKNQKHDEPVWEELSLWQLSLMATKQGVHQALDPHHIDRLWGLSEHTIADADREKRMWADALMPLALEVGIEEAGERMALEAEGGIDALLEESTMASEELPSVIYREGTPSPSNLTPRAVDNGNLSFRDSLSNPYPLAPGQRPVFRPGEPYFGVNTSKLPPGSVINDQIPAGHVSVRGVPADTIKQAVTHRNKFPK